MFYMEHLKIRSASSEKMKKVSTVYFIIMSMKILQIDTLLSMLSEKTLACLCSGKPKMDFLLL